MSVHKAAPRILMTLALGALLTAGPALAADAGYLGVMLQDLSPSMAKALQLGEESGVLINEVVDDSPAAKAGLQAGDVIVEFAGEPVADSGDLTSAVRKMAPGAKADVVVLRDGKRATIAVELGEREDTFTWVGKDGGDFKVFAPNDEDVHLMLKGLHEGDHDFAFKFSGEDRGHLGVHIDDLNAQLGEHFGVNDGNGVLITEVVEDGAAAKAGLKAGDVIVGVGDEEIEATDDLFKALAGTEVEDKVTITYVRDGKQRDVEVTLGEAPEMDLGRTYFFGGEDDEFHIMAPKMLYRHMPHMDKHDVRVMRMPHRRVEVIGEMDDDMEELREELDKLREELKELQKELKK